MGMWACGPATPGSVCSPAFAYECLTHILRWQYSEGQIVAHSLTSDVSTLEAAVPVSDKYLQVLNLVTFAIHKVIGFSLAWSHF